MKPRKLKKYFSFKAKDDSLIMRCLVASFALVGSSFRTSIDTSVMNAYKEILINFDGKFSGVVAVKIIEKTFDQSFNKSPVNFIFIEKEGVKINFKLLQGDVGAGEGVGAWIQESTNVLVSVGEYTFSNNFGLGKKGAITVSGNDVCRFLNREISLEKLMDFSRGESEFAKTNDSFDLIYSYLGELKAEVDKLQELNEELRQVNKELHQKIQEQDRDVEHFQNRYLELAKKVRELHQSCKKPFLSRSLLIQMNIRNIGLILRGDEEHYTG